jgi:uncharacterized SAM-binding protein YcdF (DUF218 family)
VNLDYLLSAVFQAAIVPPGSPILLLASAYFARHAWRTGLLLAGLGLLYLASIPATVAWLRTRIEIYPPVALGQNAAQAIVVLGAGRYRSAPEYGGADTVPRLGLERLRYAAKLSRETGLPVLASGGAVLAEAIPEAETMRIVLKEFGVEARWLETQSRNTYENAQYSARLLKNEGIEEVLLVTHAWHMPRAREAFEFAGLKAIPAPMGFMGGGTSAERLGLLNWLPDAAALYDNRLLMHELLGRWWYRLRHYR